MGLNFFMALQRRVLFTISSSFTLTFVSEIKHIINLMEKSSNNGQNVTLGVHEYDKSESIVLIITYLV
jgi:hypothetical protein